MRTNRIRFSLIFRLAVEVEAAMMARREMMACGIWRKEDVREAARGLFSYLRSLTVFSPQISLAIAIDVPQSRNRIPKN